MITVRVACTACYHSTELTAPNLRELNVAVDNLETVVGWSLRQPFLCPRCFEGHRLQDAARNQMVNVPHEPVE